LLLGHKLLTALLIDSVRRWRVKFNYFWVALAQSMIATAYDLGDLDFGRSCRTVVITATSECALSPTQYFIHFVHRTISPILSSRNVKIELTSTCFRDGERVQLCLTLQCLQVSNKVTGTTERWMGCGLGWNGVIKSGMNIKLQLMLYSYNMAVTHGVKFINSPFFYEHQYYRS
jgi:hypothetical protein